MAYKLEDKPNVVAPNGTYPYGAIKDNSGSGDGTPVNAVVYGDFHQFFARLMAIAGLVANGLPDNAVNGFQLFTALGTYISSLITTAVNAEAATRSAADTALQNNINSEASTRGTADTTLQTNITNEASSRSSADTTLQTNINNEASTRASADTALSNTIAALRVVVDIGPLDLSAGVLATIPHGLGAAALTADGISISFRDDANTTRWIGSNSLVSVLRVDSTNAYISWNGALGSEVSTAFSRGTITFRFD